jgi:adenylylsulfate reductase subunit B
MIMPPIIDKKKCNACGVCVDICPTDVFKMTEKKKPPLVRYPEECWHCNSCVLDCKQSAIVLRIPLPAMMLHVEAGAKRKIDAAKRKEKRR